MRALRSSLRLIALGKGALGLATKPSTPAAAQQSVREDSRTRRSTSSSDSPKSAVES